VNRAKKEIGEGILSAIGNTPLIRLGRLFTDAGFVLFAKLESLNPGGSLKDRPGLAILQEGLRSGAIDPESVVVESSSGNMGIALAQACRFYGLRFICVVDPKTTRQNIRILESYGAEIDYVRDPDPVTGEFLQARIDRVQQLLAKVRKSFWPNQYENRGNPDAHCRTTMHEVASALDGRVDYLFVPTSTCGTIRGCAQYVRDRGMNTRIIAVDAVGSQIFSEVRAKRLIPGLGAGIRPPLLDPSLVSRFVLVTDLECVAGCRRLMAREAIFAGGSSGAVVSAIDQVKDQITAGSNCVAILPDRGERYLDTIYCDAWVREHFGEVDHLWQAQVEDSLWPATAC
jgi:2,3-diaminopropionate biosynthesis protein SbnA